MKLTKSRLRIAAVALVAILISGCVFVSGQFVIVEPFEFTTETGFYHYYVDITDEQDWIDHHEKINEVLLVGFEMNFTNNESVPVTFDVYLADAADDPLGSADEVTAAGSGAFQILDGLTVPVGNSTTSYGSSFAYVMNVEDLKAAALSGAFHYYGIANDGSDLGFRMNKGAIIVTFDADE